MISDKRVKPYGSITAHHRESAEEHTGYVFIRGKVYGIDEVYLGRAKGPYSRVIFAKTYLSKTVVPSGWTNWSYDGSTKLVSNYYLYLITVHVYTNTVETFDQGYIPCGV